MKTNGILLMMAGLFCLTACSQDLPETQIPSVVFNAFTQNFSNVTEVEWEKKGAIYEVEFEIDNKDHKALIEETGNLVKYKKEILFQELPEALHSSLPQAKGKNKIDDVHVLVIGDNTYYQLEFEGILTDSQKVYDEAGEEMTNIIYFN